MTTFGAYLRQLRQEHNVSTIELARTLNTRGYRVTPSMIRMFEDGTALPNQSVLDHIAVLFSISADVLYVYAGYVPPTLPLPGNSQETETWLAIFRKIFEKKC